MCRFQDILDIEDGERGIAIMRGRIQLDTKTAYIFLGSVSNRMTDIFMHPNSPFYRGAAPPCQGTALFFMSIRREELGRSRA